MKSLTDQWQKWNGLHLEADAPSSDTRGAYKQSSCCLAGSCVCQGVGMEARFLDSNFTSLCCKPFFQTPLKPRAKTSGEGQAAPKAKAAKTPHRLLLEDCFLVLRLDEMEFPSMESTDTDSANWQKVVQKTLLRRDVDLSPREADLRVSRTEWLHIGFMNFSSWTWCCLRLMAQKMHADGSWTLRVPDTAVFFMGFKFCRDHLNFDGVWHATWYKIRSSTEPLLHHDMVPNEIVVEPYTPIPVHRTWAGSAVEKARREEARSRKRAQSQRQQRGRSRGQGGRGRGRRASSAPSRGLQDRGPASEAESADDGDRPAIGDAEENAGAGVSGDDDDNDDDEDDGGAALSDIEAELQDERQEDPQKRDLPPHLRVSEPASSSDAAPRAAAPSEPVQVSEKLPAKKKVRTNTERVLDLGALGSLRWYPNTNNLVAFCKRHECADCRRSRTLKESELRAWQGRPAGTLFAWLKLGHKMKERWDHVYGCFPDREQRQQARAELMLVEGAAAFLAACERPRRDGEPEEPLDG